MGRRGSRKKRVWRTCLRDGCTHAFWVLIGSEEWFCTPYCRRMARRQRPARNEDDDREWSFSDEEFIELDRRIEAYGKSVGAKTVRHLVKDGKPVQPPAEKEEGDRGKAGDVAPSGAQEGPPSGEGSDTG